MDKFLGTESFVMSRKGYNPFHHEVYGAEYDESGKKFIIRSLLKAYQYDLVHIHTLDNILGKMRFIHPRKPIIIHYHGTEIRGRWDAKKRFWKHADKILLSTDDLLEGAPEDAVYVPNMVDIDKIPTVDKKINKAYFSLEKEGWSLDLAVELAKRYGLELIVHDRNKEPLQHQEYLRKIARYEYFIDVRRKKTKGDDVLQSLSLGALEALASGSKVIDWDGELIEEFPREHDPEYVVKKIYEIYNEII